MNLKLSILTVAILFSSGVQTQTPEQPSPFMPIALATTYDSTIDVAEYWKSEKLDGIRAIWDGKQLKTRTGNPISAPKWFTQPLPNYPVEGELWAGRGNFHLVQQTVLDKTPSDKAWKSIDFMLFDMPLSAGFYQKRYFDLIHLVKSVDEKHIKYVEHTPVGTEDELLSYLDTIDGSKGEGVMLRKITSRYQAGRSTDLLKMKRFQDKEALVIGYRVGKGKYEGMMGSLLVELESGMQFYIGSGFSEEQRRNPPELGTLITFRYNGYTNNGVPKFARYIRERVN